MGGHALVFGASGITGWGVVNALLSDYPTSDAFDRVTALTNRPLPVEESGWPKSEKLNVVSGLDLLSGNQAALEESIRQQVPQIESVSHVYFFAYIFNPDNETEIQINVDLLRRAITAVDSLSEKLAFVTYGVHLLDKFPFADKLPLKESLPAIPEPFKSKLFYYPQVELLKELSANKTWKWCDVIPDIVVGFVPNNNAYCLAQWLALYLSLYRELNGPGAEVVFPGTKSWTIKSNDSNQDIIGRFSVYASLHPEWSAGERYNVADNAQYSSWSGVAPTNGPGPDPSAYIHENKEKWFELEKKYGLKGGRVGNEKSLTIVSNFLMNQFDFDRQVDMTKMHRAWGDAKEETDVQGAWHVAFDRFRAANIIPKSFT
ncbi:hypothetical protein BDW74DRAFT_188577 [Aspergillus multicolor]|uniref:SDR family oxidoreductase n=1 Tax=Aspergillus multicolor TaxID=41759 RepID=UPI003CCCCCC6